MSEKKIPHHFFTENLIFVLFLSLFREVNWNFIEYEKRQKQSKDKQKQRNHQAGESEGRKQKNKEKKPRKQQGKLLLLTP